MPARNGDDSVTVVVDVMTVLRELECGTISVEEAMILLDDSE
jgi:hypothetical protein